MAKLVVLNHVTLDGVMQSPGRPDEDTRGGFSRGGWSGAHANEEVTAATYSRVAASGGLKLLLGRRSYEEMLGHWNAQGGPFKQGLNDAPKYVVSRTLEGPLPWPNSTLLRGEAPETVARLKRELASDLFIMGSGELIEALMGHELIDEYLLFVHPLVLGSGRRLFTDGGPAASLRLLDAKPTSSGVVIARYEA